MSEANDCPHNFSLWERFKKMIFRSTWLWMTKKTTIDYKSGTKLDWGTNRVNNMSKSLRCHNVTSTTWILISVISISQEKLAYPIVAWQPFQMSSHDQYVISLSQIQEEITKLDLRRREEQSHTVFVPSQLHRWAQFKTNEQRHFEAILSSTSSSSSSSFISFVINILVSNIYGMIWLIKLTTRPSNKEDYSTTRIWDRRI